MFLALCVSAELYPWAAETYSPVSVQNKAGSELRQPESMSHHFPHTTLEYKRTTKKKYNSRFEINFIQNFRIFMTSLYYTADVHVLLPCQAHRICGFSKIAP